MPRFGMSVVGLVVLALAVTACGDTPPPSTSEEDRRRPRAPRESQAAESTAPSEAPLGDGRLADVQERGELICGVNGALPGFSFLDEDGTTSASTPTSAARSRRPSSAIRRRSSSATSDRRPARPALQTGEIDVLIRNTTWTVSRDTALGPLRADHVLRRPGDHGELDAESTRPRIEELAGATICVQSGTTTELNLADAFGASRHRLTSRRSSRTIDPTYAAYEEGRCDAVTSDRSQLVARRTAFANPDDHVILDEVLSKEPLGPVAPLGDDQWFNVVKWVVFATIEAEELGITRRTSSDMAATSDNPVVQRLLGVTPEGRALRAPASGSSRTGWSRDHRPSATTARSTTATSARTRRSSSSAG